MIEYKVLVFIIFKGFIVNNFCEFYITESSFVTCMLQEKYWQYRDKKKIFIENMIT